MTLDQYPDDRLFLLTREGDRGAYTVIYQRYSGLLYLHAYNMMRNREEARDIVQEIFTNLWNGRQSLEIKSNVSGYLYAATRNRVLKSLARKKVQSSYLSTLTEHTETDNFTDFRVREKQLSYLIEREIDNLPEKMREVFLLSRKTNLKHKEIAEKLGISESTVKTQINNALRILRAKLGLIAYILLLFKLK